MNKIVFHGGVVIVGIVCFFAGKASNSLPSLDTGLETEKKSSFSQKPVLSLRDDSSESGEGDLFPPEYRQGTKREDFYREVSVYSESLAFTNVESCLDWARELDDPEAKAIAYSKVMWALLEGSSGDQERAFLLLDEIGNGDARDIVIISNFERYLNSDFEKAVSLIETISHPGSISSAVRTLAATAYGEQLALNINSVEFGVFRHNFEREYVSVLAQTDPIRALEWADKILFSRGDGEDVFYDVAQGLVDRNPVDGFERAMTLPKTKDREKLVKILSSVWARSDPEASSDWLMSKGKEGGFWLENRDIARQIIWNSIQWDHSKIFGKIGELATTKERDILMEEAIKGLSIFDPALSVKRLDSYEFSDSSERIEVIRQIAENWLERSPYEAGEWIGSMPSGRERDAGIAALLGEVIREDNDVDLANEWLHLISDQNMKGELADKLGLKE